MTQEHPYSDTKEDEAARLKRSYRSICWTLNNWTEAELLTIRSTWLSGRATYCVFGFEEAPTTGTPHLQGFTEFKSPTKGTTIARLLPRLYFNSRYRKSTAQQAAEYCKKTAKFEEAGEISHQGERTDLAAAIEHVLQGAKIEAVALENPEPYVKFGRGLERLHFHQQKHRTEKPHVEWIWGDTGVGKTRAVFDKHGAEEVYVKDNGRWWDNYDQEQAVVFDDFEPTENSFRDILRVLDRYKYQGQVKGSYVKLNSPFIYITCDRPPEACYKGVELKQLMRRLDVVTQLTEPTMTATEVTTTQVA